MSGLNDFHLMEKRLEISFFCNDLLIHLWHWKAGEHDLYSVTISLNVEDIDKEGLCELIELDYMNYSSYCAALSQFYNFCNIAIEGNIQEFFDYE